jgi:hypothetical protein
MNQFEIFEIFMSLEFNLDLVYTIGFICFKYKNFTVDHLTNEKERENLIAFLNYFMSPEMSYHLDPKTIQLTNESRDALIRLMNKYYDVMNTYGFLCEKIKTNLKIVPGIKSEQTRSLINFDASKYNIIAETNKVKLWQIRDFYVNISRNNYLDCEKLSVKNYKSS